MTELMAQPGGGRIEATVTGSLAESRMNRRRRDVKDLSLDLNHL